jgi:hypothetical protein
MPQSFCSALTHLTPLCWNSDLTGDLVYFVNALKTFAEYLIMNGDHPIVFRRGIQELRTISGFINFITSAEDLLKSGDLTREGYVNLVNYTFADRTLFATLHHLYQKPNFRYYNDNEFLQESKYHLRDLVHMAKPYWHSRMHKEPAFTAVTNAEHAQRGSFADKSARGIADFGGQTNMFGQVFDEERSMIRENLYKFIGYKLYVDSAPLELSNKTESLSNRDNADAIGQPNAFGEVFDQERSMIPLHKFILGYKLSPQKRYDKAKPTDVGEAEGKYHLRDTLCFADNPCPIVSIAKDIVLTHHGLDGLNVDISVPHKRVEAVGTSVAPLKPPHGICANVYHNDIVFSMCNGKEEIDYNGDDLGRNETCSSTSHTSYYVLNVGCQSSVEVKRSKAVAQRKQRVEERMMRYEETAVVEKTAFGRGTNVAEDLEKVAITTEIPGSPIVAILIAEYIDGEAEWNKIIQRLPVMVS